MSARLPARPGAPQARRLLQVAALFVPCYVLLDWASYIEPVGPFNITPWNPQPALAILWMMRAGPLPALFVFATIVLAEFLIRGAPAGVAVTLLASLALTLGYAAIAATLRALLREAALKSARDLAVFSAVIVAGTAAVSAVFVAILFSSAQLSGLPFGSVWLRCWVGDAVGILVTMPLLLVVEDALRRPLPPPGWHSLEALLQVAVLGGAFWFIFWGPDSAPARRFYLLFAPLIWIALRAGLNGAITASAIVQGGVILETYSRSATFSYLELQILVATYTLTGLFLGVVVDERRKSDERLQQTLRLAAAGEMAGAIAHELNQPLTALANYSHAAQMLIVPSPDPRLGGILARILLEADRAADVVRRLRDLFRSGTTRLEEVPVGELLQAAQRIGRAAIGEARIRLEVGAEAQLPRLYVDRLQVEVVLRNLLANAVESILGAHAASGDIRIFARRHTGQQVCITVQDSGPGIGPEARATLFQPFVSGKPTGMGLGLAVSRAIAEAHGGSLAASADGRGEFALVLPCLPAP